MPMSKLQYNLKLSNDDQNNLRIAQLESQLRELENIHIEQLKNLEQQYSQKLISSNNINLKVSHLESLLREKDSIHATQLKA